ncbi:hypothetical protein H4W31_007593 [Plantactinospora soyae]|uniref:Uncharacterized protein n=1 Tax=Plantactinospora soyae TaxID=1544732 RepID=A0A927R0T8_9ACTN|nr:hypothetical protein [Plantactinospora soyae]
MAPLAQGAGVATTTGRRDPPVEIPYQKWAEVAG